MTQPGGRPLSWGALAHVFLAIALALPLVVAGLVVGYAMVANDNSMIDRTLVAALGVLFLAAGVWVALLPPVRQVEISTARTLLDIDLPDAGQPRAWDSRRRGAWWLAILIVTGLVGALGVLYLLPLGVGLIAYPFTGADHVRWPGGDAAMPTGTGWGAAWVAVLGLLALAALVIVLVGAGIVLRRWAPRVIGPTLTERVALAAGRERDLARANALAREVHDGIGHTLTAMTVQASAARRLLARDPEAADRALATIEELGRRAQADVDGVVGALRDSGAGARTGTDDSVTAGPATEAGATGSRPAGTPAADDLIPHVRDLIAHSGLAVDLTAPARVELASGAGRAAYRIVQEGLTNAGRHGSGPGTLTIRQDASGVEIEMRNPFQDRATRVGGGAGLAGLRERVLLLGGSLEAGPDDGGSWRLRARIPR